MTIKTDNGSEFISKVMDKWTYERGVEPDFSRPRKPTDNAMVENFNGRLRQECLNVGLCACKTQGIKLRLDGASITRRDLTVR